LKLVVCAGLLRKLDVLAARPPDDVAVRLSADDVFVPKWRALSYLHARKRAVYDYDDGWDAGGGGGGGGERGLACECCVHMCSYDEMIEYCQQPHLRKRLTAVAKQTDR